MDSWYSEVKNYNYKRSRYSPGAGHFTQLVWVASRKLGLGVAKRNGEVVVVANYDPRGNIDSKERFKKNVRRPMRPRGNIDSKERFKKNVLRPI